MPRPADLAPGCDHEVGCITCGDTAVELRVREVDKEGALADCFDDAGRLETVQTALVGAVARGDVLLVHAGTAIHKLEDGA